MGLSWKQTDIYGEKTINYSVENVSVYGFLCIIR
jgi:hypothetical protein